MKVLRPRPTPRPVLRPIPVKSPSLRPVTVKRPTKVSRPRFYGNPTDVWTPRVLPVSPTLAPRVSAVLPTAEALKFCKANCPS